MQFRKATKQTAKLRMALIGPAGSGKTYSALNIASHLGRSVAVIDTEHGSASKYADLWSFDTLELESFDPRRYVEAIHAAEAAGYETLVIDSLSHAWMGKDGALELVDRAAKRDRGGNKFSAWGDVTPLQNALVDTIIGASLHVIATVRSKMEYVQEVGANGRTSVRKVGLQPVQRDGLEYEFDVVGDLTSDNELVIGKTRCPALVGQVIPKPGAEVAEALKRWLSDGEPAQVPIVMGRPGKPRTAEEAEERFWATFGGPLGGTDWPRVEELFGLSMHMPETIERWIKAYAATDAKLREVAATEEAGE